jgi:hypothetical protein
MDRKTLYIAETNADGHIEWVWVARPGRRAPRPFHPAKDKFDPGRTAEYVGAVPKAVISWLAASIHHR